MLLFYKGRGDFLDKLISILLGVIAYAIAFLFPTFILFSGISPISKLIIIFAWIISSMPMLISTGNKQFTGEC